MPPKPSKNDYLLALTANLLTLGTSIVTIPITLYFLTEEETGLWFVFITLMSLAQLLDMGFQPTVSRNISYAYCGVTLLKSKGLPHFLSASDKSPNRQLLQSLLGVSVAIYSRVALCSLILLTVGGGVYVYSLVSSSGTPSFYLISWSLCALGAAINLYYGYQSALLQGCGLIGRANVLIIISRVSFFLIAVALLISGLKLLGLAVATLASAAVMRAIGSLFVFQWLKSMRLTVRTNKALNRRYFKILWFNAKRMSVVQIGAFLIQRVSVLVAASSLGLSASASYSLTITISNLISGISQVYANACLPHMTSLRLARDSLNLKRRFARVSIVSVSSCIAAFFLLGVFGNIFLVKLGSNTILLGPGYILMLGLIFALEVNHSVSASYLTISNNVPFVRASIVSGIMILLLCAYSARPFGIIGLILSQGLVQLSYNNWR